jgi:hypothetical protein
MTDRNENSIVESPATEAQQPAVDVSRRSMLRRAAPAIVTLYSGAALAQSSNLITADSTPGPDGGKYRCLNVAGVDKVGNKYDLGTNPMGQVTQIQSQKQYYKIINGQRSSQTVTQPEMCSTGGEFYRKDGSNSYTKVKVNFNYNKPNKGVLVSATALSSFSSSIKYTDV